MERIIEIIVYVISELRQKKEISEIDLDTLEKLGYSNSEISTAFSWIIDQADMTDSKVSEVQFTNSRSFRILHEVERDLFTKDALGELIQLHSLKILSNDNIESIIERTLLTGASKIDSADLKSMVSDMLFNSQFNNSIGSRILLRGNDTIN